MQIILQSHKETHFDDDLTVYALNVNLVPLCKIYTSGSFASLCENRFASSRILDKLESMGIKRSNVRFSFNFDYLSKEIADHFDQILFKKLIEAENVRNQK